MNFGSLLAGNILYRGLNIATGMLITALFTRLMGAQGYGVLSLLVANVSVFSLISCLGSESGITFHYASGSLNREKIFTIIYLVIFFQLAFLTAIELIHHQFTGQYWLVGGKEIKFLLWGLLYLFSVTVIDKYKAFLNASHRYTLANEIIFFSNLISLTAVGSFFFFSEQKDILFYLQIFIGAGFLQALLLAITFHIVTKQRIQFVKTGRSAYKLFFSYSFLVLITNVIQFFAYRVDYWLVHYFKGNEALGLYSLAVRLGQLFWALPLLFASIIFPMMADKEKNYDETKLLALIRTTNAISFIAMLAATALAGWVIPFVFGEGFKGSVRPFLYLLPGLFLFSINIMLASYFAAKNRLMVNFTGSVICLLLVLALDLWLIPIIGIEGAAIASSVA